VEEDTWAINDEPWVSDFTEDDACISDETDTEWTSECTEERAEELTDAWTLELDA